jgi:hypothetical protein
MPAIFDMFAYLVRGEHSSAPPSAQALPQPKDLHYTLLI